MEKIKQTKGITLVALILTIVILLILAVVTIRSIQGEGMISKAMQAREDYEDAADEEQGMLDTFFKEIDELSQGESEAQSTIASVTEEGIPIPKGFKYIEGTKDTGVVIENRADGSQFVWVPLDTYIEEYKLNSTYYREPEVIIEEYNYNTGTFENGADNNIEFLNIMNNILGTNYSNSSDFLKDMEADFNAMLNGVNKNKGFYVGRYETSIEDEKAQSIKGVTSASGSIDRTSTWYKLYAIQKKYSTDSVEASMIWGTQYNAMMTWMQNTGTDINSSIGNNRNQSRETGTVETDKINNVYDLYGNNYEWTLEADLPYNRVGRGGDIYNSHSPSSRSIMSSPKKEYNTLSSRMTLYIK